MNALECLDRAAACKAALASAPGETKNRALFLMAEALESQAEAILRENREDLRAASGSVSPVMADRLRLTEARLSSMAQSIRDVAALEDPVGRVLETRERPNGLRIQKISVPLGLLAMIYESRPNVTADAAALSLKSGNVCVLRGGKEAVRSNRAIAGALRDGLEAAGLPRDAVCLVDDISRQSAVDLMTAVGKVDLLIPRGGAGLIRSCVENAKVPCIETGVGICHIYVDREADLSMALDLVENAKVSRPSVCNAAEVCLVHERAAAEFLPRLQKRLTEDREAAGLPPVELRLDPRAGAVISGKPAGEGDFDTEFLDYILAVKVVGSLSEAISHIGLHSTGHSECIVTRDPARAERFTRLVDSAAVYVNASTRFTDGGEFGLGCEMGISTQKLHARGPMGLRELTSYKYVISGAGQIRK